MRRDRGGQFERHRKRNVPRYHLTWGLKPILYNEALNQVPNDNTALR